MLVGHNPTMEELTELLCGQSPEYPTAALGTITLADRPMDAMSHRAAARSPAFVTAGPAARPTLMAWR